MFSWFTVAQRQFGRFVAVGSMGVVVDFGVYIILTRGYTFWQQHYLWANVLAFLVANAHNFFWHRRWTFSIKSGGLAAHYLKFLLTTLGYLAIIETGLWLFTHYLVWPDLLAKVVATAMAVLVYFTVLKLYIFKPKLANPDG